MTPGILGYKVGMTSVFTPEGKVLPVTIVAAGPCVVVQHKTAERDGYVSLQLGFRPAKKRNRPVSGHFKAAGVEPCRHLREFPVEAESLEKWPVGGEVTVSVFADGDQVTVSGRSIGKGFQGVVKRHGFAGGPATHGSMSHRAPGSIGGSNPDRVLKGKRMAGRMGNRRVTVKNLRVFRVDAERNLLLLVGPVPGAENGLLEIRKK